MSVFGITAVRLDRDGWVEAAEFDEITQDGDDFVLGAIGERKVEDIATMIKGGAKVYCIFVQASKRGPQFAVANLKHGREGIKLVDDVPGRGLQQLIQLEKPAEEQNNPLGSW